MSITVLVEPVPETGFRARTSEPLALTAEGKTREIAIQELKAQLLAHMQNGAEFISLNVDESEDPWVGFRGMFKDDPHYDEWQQAIAENRQEAEKGPDIV